MIKVAFLVYDVSLTGGAEKVAINLASEFSNKYSVSIISVFNEKNHKKSDRYDFFVLSKKTIKIPFHLKKLSSKIRNYLKENNIDVILAITAGVNELAYFGTLRTKTKMIYCEHSNLENKTYGKKHELRQLLGAKKANLVVTLTERDRENFIKAYHLKNVVSIPNWYTSTNIKEKYDSNSKKIISVGRLEKVKGYDLLVKSAKEVYDKHPDWHWDIYGEGSYHDIIQNQINENKLEKFITLKGNVNNLASLYKEYAFLVMTSYYEGLPLSLLEAQSHNLPIISFNCPTGPDEIITDGENGFIVNAYDINEMSNKIIELIEDKETRIKFANKSKKDLKKYDKNDILKRWYDTIDKVVKGNE